MILRKNKTAGEYKMNRFGKKWITGLLISTMVISSCSMVSADETVNGEEVNSVSNDLAAEEESVFSENTEPVVIPGVPEATDMTLEEKSEDSQTELVEQETADPETADPVTEEADLTEVVPDEAGQESEAENVTETPSETETETEKTALPTVAVSDKEAESSKEKAEEKKEKKAEEETVSGKDRTTAESAATPQEASEEVLPQTVIPLICLESDLPGLSEGLLMVLNAGTAESSYVVDPDKETEAVDNSTTLDDGNYTPDAFSWSGGTGKTVLTCPKIIVEDGKAYATIHFSSKNFDKVKADGKIYTTEVVENGSEAVIPIDLNVSYTIQGETTAMSEPHFVPYEITVTLEESAESSEESPYEEDPDAETEKVDNSTTLADGEYSPDNFSWSGGTGKTVISCTKVTVKNGKAYATIHFSSQKFDKVKADGKIYTTEVVEDGAEAVIPIDLNMTYELQGETTAMGDPHFVKYQVTVTLDEETATPTPAPTATPTATASPTPTTTPTPTATATPTAKPTATPTALPTTKPGQLADGIYSVTASTGALMFKVVNAVLTVKNGVMTADVTLSGVGYDYLYAGTKAEAEKAKTAELIPYYENADGQYVYTIPVSTLKKATKVASHSKRLDTWYDREITFDTSTLKKIGDVTDDPTPTPTRKPTAAPTPTPAPTAQDESEHSADTSGSTAAVDSSTGLKDGVYTPDAFSWSGGTGKVNILCKSVTVTDGKAYATIAFTSSKYGYIKASGNIYYTSVIDGQSVATIPVTLNKNNTIIGMTTAMSAAHEISYNIYIYLAGAEGAKGGNSGKAIGSGSSKSETLDEEAPDIIGLSYDSETEITYAEKFRIYHYDQGVTLIEIDMTKDTARDPALSEADTDSDESADTDTESSEEEEYETIVNEDGELIKEVKTQEEITAELYLGNVVKYLLVPEDAEIPAGLEKEVVVIELPAEKAYSASEETLGFMTDNDLLGKLSAIDREEEDLTDQDLLQAFAEDKLVFGGTYDDPVFKNLIKADVDIAFLTSDILPRLTEEEEAEAENSDLEKEKQTEEEILAEKTELFEDITSQFATIGIPMIVDRSSDETYVLGQKEWIKVYGALFGFEDEADEIFEKEVKAAKAAGEDKALTKESER